jgi:formylglycine-generating enzyme required for sulfatase activity
MTGVISPAPRVFVSHSHADNEYCRAYVAGLRTRGYVVWYDEHNLGWGAIRSTIESELQKSQHFVAILSPASVASQWVNAEIDAALELVKERKLQTFLFVMAVRCAVPLLLRQWKRIEGPGGAAVDVAEAAAKTANIIGIASKEETAEPLPPQMRRPLRLSRRQVLIGTGVATGLVVVGSVAWLARPGQGSGSTNAPSIVLPERLASLGFILRTKGSTRYIVPPLSGVPAGEFLVGSDLAQDPQAFDNEKPQSRLTLGAFQIAKHPLTVAEYAAFVQQGGHSAPGHWTNQQQKPDHPVVNVSWLDAQAYAAWLAQATGDSWRLPTEAEREKAARGTDGRFYPWGNTFDTARCNSSMSVGTTTPVGTYPSGASPYGVQDMAGNVWEWTSSQFIPYPYNASDGREDPNSPGDRVDRGGSWYSLPRYVRAACRYGNPPNFVGSDIGFRLVLAATVS